MSWDTLPLPEGFPHLRDYVTFYSTGNLQSNSDPRYFITWNVMPESEVVQMIDQIRASYAKGSSLSVRLDNKGSKHWDMKTDDFRISILWEKNSKGRTYLNLFPKDKNYKFPMGLENAASKLSESSERMLEWDSFFIDGRLPKLTDRVSGMKTNDDGYSFISWSDISLNETKLIVKRLIESFEGEYKCEYRLNEEYFAWKFECKINGVNRTVSVSHWENDSAPYRRYYTVLDF